jgi:hypothetical protein
VPFDTAASTPPSLYDHASQLSGANSIVSSSIAYLGGGGGSTHSSLSSSTTASRHQRARGQPVEQPRFVTVTRSADVSGHDCGWGFTICGGNAVGIFVDRVLRTHDDELVQCGTVLRVGDHVLEVRACVPLVLFTSDSSTGSTSES